MIRPRVILPAVAGACLTLAPSARAGDDGVWTMPAGDAVIRRTDSTSSGALNAGQGLPDLIGVRIEGWQPTNPTTDPYTGSVVNESAHVLRLRVTFAGLVNPPGTLGLASQPYAPMAFGNSPVFGFIEFDVDRDRDTGGEYSSGARLRPLANASRFGTQFDSSLADRQSVWGTQNYQTWDLAPQIARSGADFSLNLCGCFGVTVVSQSNPGSSTFGPGQTWVVRGRFFARSGGYNYASLMQGGSYLGAYDPAVNLQFSHDVPSNITTITLVYPIDQIGAASLTGEPVQPVNTRADDHFSIEEGVADLIASAGRSGLTGLTRELVIRWAGKHVSDSLDPTRWRAKAIVGTAYPQPQDALYVWTDVGLDLLRRDVNGDGRVDASDRQAIQSFIAAYDGGSKDADGMVNGRVVIADFGTNFCLYDTNGDGVIDSADLGGIPLCAADWNADGVVSVQDVFDFIAGWFAGSADFNGTGGTTVQDIFDFLSAWFIGC